MCSRVQCLMSGYLCQQIKTDKKDTNNDTRPELLRTIYPEVTHLPFCEKDNECILERGIKSLACSWTALIVEESPRASNAGSTLHIQGFIDGVSQNEGIIYLKLPESLRVEKFVIGRDKIIVLDQAGNLYKNHLGEWKKIMTDTEAKFVDLIGQDGNVIALDDQGFIWSPPTCLFPNLNLKVSTIACGKEHFVAVTQSGDVYSWGCGSRGQLGHGTLLNEEQPRLIESLQGIRLEKVACGGWHTCVVSNSGDLYVWGWNESGQLGLPCAACQHSRDKTVNIQSEPVLLETFGLDDSPVKMVACGSRHSAAVLEDGSGWSWGWNGKGQLGLGDLVSRDRPTRVTGFYSPSSAPTRQSMPLLSGVMASAWNTFWLTS